MLKNKSLLLTFAPLFVTAWTSLATAAAPAVQDQNDLPATLAESVALKTKLVNDFNTHPDLTLDEQYALIQRVLNLDTYTIAKLETGDAAFLGDTKESAESLISASRDSTIATSFYLANLLDEARRFEESAKTLDYVVANSLKHYGLDHWKTREYQLKLVKEKWLVAANEEKRARFAQAQSANTNGLAAFRANDAKTARELLLQAKLSLEELELTNIMAYGEAVANLAEAVAVTDTLENGTAAFQDALNVNDGLFLKKSPTNASMRQSLAMYLNRNGKADQAIAPLEEAAEIFKTVYGDKSVALAQCLSLKGAQLQAMQQFQEAQNLHLQAYGMLNDLGQTNSQAALYVFDNMFNLFSTVGQHKDAADIVQRAVPISEAVYTNNPGQTVFWLVRGGNANRLSANYEKAVEQYTAAKEMLEAANGTAKNQQYIESLSGLAMSYYLLGQLDQAVELGSQASELSKEFAGENSIFHLVRAQNLGLFLTQSKEYEKAEVVFARILPPLKASLGEANLDYQKTVFDHATNFLRSEKADAAIKQLEYLRVIQEQTIGRAHPDYSATLETLTNAYEKKGATDQAEKTRQELEAIKQAAADKAGKDGAGNDGKGQQTAGMPMPN